MERLLEYFVPERYMLDLEIDKYKKTIRGEVTVWGCAEAENIKFHAVGLSIDKVLVNGKKVKFEVADGVLTLFKVPGSDLEVEIGYHGTLNKNMEGAYLSTYEYRGRTEVIVATQFESHYAREAFPCIDEPAAKAEFLVVITVPMLKGETVISNMPAMDYKIFNEKGREKVKTIFMPTPRMSTYLLAWVIGRFNVRHAETRDGVLVATYVPKNQNVNMADFANEVAVEALEFYGDNFGVQYPLPKLSQVALPDFEAGAMENWGLVTYRESMLLASKNATLATKKSVALTVAHELSHQWFGNLVTMEWWDDLWLNESFATVMEYFAVDAIYPEFKIWEAFFTGDACAALVRDAYTGVQSVHQDVADPAEIATLFDAAIVYAKGARLILMLIRLMGWEEFCEGIQDYFEEFACENTVGDDLWMCLEPYAEFDPEELMHAFIDKPGYPVVTNTGVDFDKFKQKRFLLDGPCVEDEWPLPEIREDMSGHYVLNLTEAEFDERLKRFDKLGLEEKLRLLIDRDLITKAGLASPVSLVPLAMKFKDESSAAVWNKISAIVGNLKVYFDDESEEEKRLKKYVLALVDEKLAEVGMVTGADDDENMIRLRANLMGLDYYAEDTQRLEELAAMYDKDYTKMDAEVRDNILMARAYLDPTVVDEYLKKYQKISDPDVRFDYLCAATEVRDVKELGKLVALLGKNKVVKPQDQLYLFIWLYRNPKCRMEVLDWLVKNWELVKRMGGDKSLSSYPTVLGHLMRTEEEYKKYREFFGPMRSELALKRAIEIGLNEIKARLELIKKNREEIYRVI